jgi:hypothetical protein
MGKDLDDIVSTYAQREETIQPQGASENVQEDTEQVGEQTEIEDADTVQERDDQERPKEQE